MKPEVIKEISVLANRAANAEANLITGQTLAFAGRNYLRNGAGWIEVEPLEERNLPMPPRYQLTTLSGLIDYLMSNVDNTTEAKAVVHVESPWSVQVVGPTVGFKKQRPVFAQVHLVEEGHPFGKYQQLENFMVWLRSRFIPTPDSENLIKALSGVKDGEVKTVVDTGLSQEVSIKVGVDMTDRGQIKNPVVLQPYRTFREIEQPTSEFLVRLQSGEKLPVVALYEADGGTWQVSATRKIVEFLREGLEGAVTVLS